MPSTSIQCFPSSRSTSRLPVTGCSIIPRAEAAFDAIDIMKLTKLAGSLAPAISSSPDSASDSSKGSNSGGAVVAVSCSACTMLGAAAAGCSVTAAWGSGLSSGGSSRGLPSELNSRRSVTLKFGCSSSISVLATWRGEHKIRPTSAFYLNSRFAIDGSIQLPKLANRYATEPEAVATALKYEYNYDTNPD